MLIAKVAHRINWVSSPVVGFVTTSVFSTLIVDSPLTLTSFPLDPNPSTLTVFFTYPLSSSAFFITYLVVNIFLLLALSYQ